MQAGYVHQFARCAVGLGRVKDKLAFEVEEAGHDLGQLADGDVFAGSDVDQRWCVFEKQGVEAGLVEVHQEGAGLGKVVGVEELAARGSGTPDGELARASGDGFGRLADQGGEDVRVVKVEVIAGTVEVGGHGSEILCPVLAVVTPAHLDAGDLSDGVGPVGGLEGTRK